MNTARRDPWNTTPVIPILSTSSASQDSLLGGPWHLHSHHIRAHVSIKGSELCEMRRLRMHAHLYVLIRHFSRR